MLIQLLKKYPTLKIIIQSKKSNIFNMVLNKVPALDWYIRKSRVLLPSKGDEKTYPADVSSKSDLAIGLGVSTAAAECCFSGTVSFHVDLTHLYSNKFANKFDGKFVFRNISDLKKAVENQINGIGYTLQECKECHNYLDPFQDGNAYKRTGNLIKKIYKSL